VSQDDHFTVDEETYYFLTQTPEGYKKANKCMRTQGKVWTPTKFAVDGARAVTIPSLGGLHFFKSDTNRLPLRYLLAVDARNSEDSSSAYIPLRIVSECAAYLQKALKDPELQPCLDPGLLGLPVSLVIVLQRFLAECTFGDTVLFSLSPLADEKHAVSTSALRVKGAQPLFGSKNAVPLSLSLADDIYFRRTKTQSQWLLTAAGYCLTYFREPLDTVSHLELLEFGERFPALLYRTPLPLAHGLKF